MRKLASEDKVKANKIANEGGLNIISDLRTLVQCELKLIYSRDDFFNKDDRKAPFHQKKHSIDSEIPILHMISRQTDSIR